MDISGLMMLNPLNLHGVYVNSINISVRLERKKKSHDLPLRVSEQMKRSKPQKYRQEYLIGKVEQGHQDEHSCGNCKANLLI